MNETKASETIGKLTANVLETALIGDDLSKLSIADRLTYYSQVCTSVGLNPLTRPLEYITLNGRLTLYARRDCTEQLRKIHEVSVESLESKTVDGVFVVTAKVKDKTGRTDVATGAVTIANAKGDTLANLLMKAETKAKRRATLSICGLGLLDETEIETLPSGVVNQPEPIKPPQRLSESPKALPTPEKPKPELHLYRIENLKGIKIEAQTNRKTGKIENWTIANKSTGFIFTILKKEIIDSVIYAREKNIGIGLQVDPAVKDKKLVVDCEPLS